MKAQFSSVKVGDPREEGTQVGPIISKKQFDQVQSYIDKGIEEGAELFYGGPGKPEGLEKDILLVLLFSLTLIII